MILLPAIDIRDGRAVRLERGDFDRETVYADDPLEAARSFVEAGASFLHIVDLDGAREGEPVNLRHVERITSELDVAVELGGGLRSIASIRRALGAGVMRVVLGTAATVGGDAHNVWWLHDPVTGSRRYAFVGEESGPAQIGFSSAGDIHVVDVSDLSNPREVAFFHVPGAGTHNFSVDESAGVLYAAFYNGGVRALDVRGDLGTCTAAQQSTTSGVTRCDLAAMGREVGRGLAAGSPRVYVWGVQLANDVLYASDMLNGLWKLQTVR